MAGCAQSAGSYPLYEGYEDLAQAADIVVSAEVLSDRRDLADGFGSPARVAQLRVLAADAGGVEAGDEVEFHYAQPMGSNFTMEEGQSYVVFGVFYPEDGEAYTMSDSQGIYGRDGAHVIGFDGDDVELPSELLESLG